MLPLYVYETIPFCRMVNFHFPIVDIPFPNISSPKVGPETQSVDLFCFNILLSSSVQSLVIKSKETKSDVLKFGSASEQGAETTYVCTTGRYDVEDRGAQ